MSRRTVCLMTAPSPSHGPLPWPAQPNSTQIIERHCRSEGRAAGLAGPAASALKGAAAAASAAMTAASSAAVAAAVAVAVAASCTPRSKIPLTCGPNL
eukprot:4001188-Prymnesium_polylepis.1